MALKDYKFSNNQCILNNHQEFTRLMKWFLKHGAENCCGNDIPMFESLYYLLYELDVKYEDFNYDGDDEDGGLLIKDESELESFLLNNINNKTLVPSEEEYPILVSWYREESFDRIGNCGIKILNFTTLNNIKPMTDYLVEYVQDIRKIKNENRKYMDYRKESLYE
ncbi:hypothetical protein [Clostridium sp.]|uniref:hypothetical protein n=1 Tax=Clostridium sp. TaxID=1506 RepID=UPI002623470A|nr:hypothetical protein [Clostridium sp.]